MTEIKLGVGTWTNTPPEVKPHDGGLSVTSAEASDYWRETSYGFIHDSGHALLNEFPDDSSLEVSWMLDYDQQFDQAGLMVWGDDTHWTKAGVEVVDGAPQIGAVVTDVKSDWSAAPVPEWSGQEVHLRISRSGDALTIRARCTGEWQLVRLVPLDPSIDWKAGIYCASPTRAGLTIRFTGLQAGDADASLHDEG